MTGALLRSLLLILGGLLSVAGSAADLRKATVQPTYTLDLESGKTGGLGGTQDLYWQAKTSSERCLGPFYEGRALLASLPSRDYDQADAAKLASLVYSSRCLSHTISGGELEKGLTFAVRTSEGNFAKVKVAGIASGNRLELEWRVYPPPAAAAANPSLSIPQLLEQARQSLRARKPDEAVPHLQQAVAQAEKLPRGAPRAEALGEAGSLLWSARRQDLAESALLASAREMENLPASRIPADAREKTYRMLGIVYRDLRRPADSVPWLERAVKTGEARPEASPQASSTKYLNMTSNLQELANQQCAAGNLTDAAASDQRRLEACGKLRNPSSVAACIQSQRSCEKGYMRVAVEGKGMKQEWPSR